DIMPRIVTSGLWRPVAVVVENAISLTDVHWMTSKVDVEGRTARIFVDVQARMPFEAYDKAVAVIRLSRGGNEVYRGTVPMATHTFRHEINLGNVDLWWPRGYGEAVLYEAEVVLLD